MVATRNERQHNGTRNGNMGRVRDGERMGDVRAVGPMSAQESTDRDPRLYKSPRPTDWTRVIQPGSVHIYESRVSTVYCTIQYKDGRLSVTGVEGPKTNGDADGSCGQIVMSLDPDAIVYVKGWNAETMVKFLAIWKRWHLNDMRAGSPDQETHLRANPVQFTYPESHYDKARESLSAVGLNPDPRYLHNGEPYSYGHAWLSEDVPEDVLQWLYELPNITTAHPWGRNG